MELRVMIDYAEQDVVVKKEFKTEGELLDFIEDDLNREVEKALDPYRKYNYSATIEFDYCLGIDKKDFNRLLKLGMVEIDGKKINQSDIERMLDDSDE